MLPKNTSKNAFIFISKLSVKSRTAQLCTLFAHQQLVDFLSVKFSIVCFQLQQQKNHKMNKPFYGVATMPQSDRSSLLIKRVVPGPGTYDYKQQKNRNELPKWSLRKQLSHGSCFQNLSITPGPGGYEIHQGIIQQPEKIISTKGEKYRHYIEKCFPNSPLNLPGCLNLKAGFSFGYRQAVRESQKSPGPVYHLDKIVQEKRLKKLQNSHRGFGFGEKNTIYKMNDNTPGPGSFEIAEQRLKRNQTCQNWTFGTAKRGDSPPSNQLGPGEYDSKIQSILSRSFKLKRRGEPRTIEQTSLGPGSYELPDTKTKLGTTFNIRKTKEPVNFSHQENFETNISPFSYDPPRFLQRPQKHGFSLGKKLQSNLDRQSQALPGPGSYQISKNQFPNQGGYMGRKAEHKKKNGYTADNFNKYDPNLNSVARESPKFSIPQSRRYDGKQNHARQSRSQMFYQTVDAKAGGCSYSIGTAKRFGELKKDSGPFRQSQNMYSTVGQLPSYLKKVSKKK